MKHTFNSLLIGSALFVIPQVVSATLLVGFHDFDGTMVSQPADYALTGFSGTVYKTEIPAGVNPGVASSVDDGGSIDGTYGNLNFPGQNPPPTPDGYIRSVETWVQDGENHYSIIGHSFPVIKFVQSLNTSTALGAFVFDAATNGYAVNTPSELVVSYAMKNPSMLVPVTGSATFEALPGTLPVVPTDPLGSLQYGEYTFSLLGLTLEQGGWIEFTFNGNPYAKMDNLALSTIPEPGSLLALGCLVGSGAFLRTRRRRG